MKRPLAALTATVLAATVLAGCNDAKDTGASADPSTPTSSAPATGASPSAGASAAANAPGAGTEYCTLLGSDFSTMFANISGPEDAQKVVGLMRRVAAAAPPAVAEDWKVLGGAFDQMQSALTQAAELQKKAEAKQITQQQLKTRMAALMKQTQALSTPRNNAAGQAVAKQASDYCGINLGG